MTAPRRWRCRAYAADQTPLVVADRSGSRNGVTHTRRYTCCMSKMIAVRLQDEIVSRVDFERRRAGLTRAAVINEALRLWVATRQYEEAVRRDQEGYEQHPV